MDASLDAFGIAREDGPPFPLGSPFGSERPKNSPVDCFHVKTGRRIPLGSPSGRAVSEAD